MKFANNKDVFVSFFVHTRDGMEHDTQFQFDGWDKEMMLEKFNEFMTRIGMLEKDETVSIVSTKKKPSKKTVVTEE